MNPAKITITGKQAAMIIGILFFGGCVALVSSTPETPVNTAPARSVIVQETNVAEPPLTLVTEEDNEVVAPASGADSDLPAESGVVEKPEEASAVQGAPTPPEDTGAIQAEASSAQSATVWTVTRVIDGDTVDVSDGTMTVRIRPIGIDAPEIDECYASEATARATSLLSGTEVQLVSDPTQDDLDRYGRSLRYVTMADGRDFGRTMIEGGYAEEYTFDAAYAKQTVYRSAETTAKNAKVGLWSPNACASPEPDPALEPQSQTEPSATVVCSCSGNTYNCSNFSTHMEAQNCYQYCMDTVGYDVHRLDGNDNDGLACEHLP